MQRTDQSAAEAGTAQLAAVEVSICGLAEQGAFSGAVLVAREGVPLLSRGYGWANLEQATRNTSQTKFQIASISKQFTALAILILQEQSRLDLHQPLNTLVPTDLLAWQDVTPHHLLTHTSGIPDLPFWPNYIDPAVNGPITPAYLRELFGDKPLQFQPGTMFVYSNWGYILLGYVIEQISGMPYAEFLQRWIFAPVGMTGSGYADRKRVLPGRAASYAFEGGEPVNASFLDLEDAYAAGGLYSTVEDLLRWERVLSGETLATAASLGAMFTPHVAVGDGSSYGYGWQIGRRFGRHVQYHGGRIDGFRVQLARYPDEQVCVVVLCNLQSCDPEPLADALAGALFATTSGRA